VYIKIKVSCFRHTDCLLLGRTGYTLGIATHLQYETATCTLQHSIVRAVRKKRRVLPNSIGSVTETVDLRTPTGVRLRLL